MWRFYLVVVVVLSGCGGSSGSAGKGAGEDTESDVEVGYSADDFVSRAALERAELTTAVDERRYRAAAEVTTEFSAREKVIYFVGKLKNVPTDAEIEVRWFIDASNEPLLVSEVRGSSTFQFIATFRPEENKFDRGSHTARVYVNDMEIDSVPFEIFDQEMELKGIRISGVAVSKKVNKKNRPVNKTTQFKKATKKVHVSFKVAGADRGTVADVSWIRGGNPFFTEDVVMDGDRRYSAHISSDDGLPMGSYNVEISLPGARRVTQSFVVGTPSTGPTIEKIELGLELGSNNLPNRPLETFSSNCGGIFCGVRFLDLAPHSIIELQWIQLEEGEESVRYKSRSELSAGGEGTMGAAWEPKYPFEIGSYKLVVLVNGEPLAETLFEVE